MLTTNNPVSPFEEVVPAAAAVRGLTRSSILTQRRRVRAAAQTGTRYGAAGAGGNNQQIQFIVADAGGLLDPESICFVYNIQTAGTGATAPDDGHPFTRIQVNLNGQPLEDVQQAARATNAEVKLSCGHNWYKGAGSFCGFELLNNELAIGAPPAANPATPAQILAYVPAWADVNNNLAAVASRSTGNGTGGGAVPWNPLGGEQRILPLGLASGVGRMKQYLPLNVLGELNITLYTGSAAETVVQAAGNTDGTFSLNGVFIEYDIVVPHPAYAELLQKLANDPSEAGLLMPYESTITATGGAIAASAGSLADTSLIVSRATQNLLRTYLVQQPTAIINSANYPSQSCFGHAGTYSIQFRVGSQYFPAIPAEGDASMWAMTALAYGTASTNDNGGTVNREMWRVFTNAVPLVANALEGFTHFAGSDSFIPAYGFQVVKGKAEALDVDGISLSGASGSQLVVQLRSAPASACTPMVGLVALRFISAQGGAVRVMGA